jgi:hypothetical protein
MSNSGFFPGVRRPEREADLHSPIRLHGAVLS